MSDLLCTLLEEMNSYLRTQTSLIQTAGAAMTSMPLLTCHLDLDLDHAMVMYYAYGYNIT